MLVLDHTAAGHGSGGLLLLLRVNSYLFQLNHGTSNLSLGWQFDTGLSLVFLIVIQGAFN